MTELIPTVPPSHRPAIRSRAGLTAAVLTVVLAGCAAAPPAGGLAGETDPASSSPDAVTAAPEQASASPSPVSERDRERAAAWSDAVRGLTFETGRVVVDAPPARSDPTAAMAFIAEGDVALAANRSTSAVRAYASAVRAAPDDPDAYLRLARSFIVKGKIDLAIAAYRTSLDHDPDSVTAHVALARSLDRVGQRDEAIATMRDALDLDPDHGAAHERLAIWLSYQGDLAEAWQHVHAARAVGYPVPPQFITRLSGEMADPGAG